MSTDLDTVFDVLSSRERRRVLRAVDANGVVSRADLSFSDDRRNELVLVHNHLPKLADAGVIEWNREAGLISRGPRFDAVMGCLDLLDTHADELAVGGLRPDDLPG